MHLHSNIVDIYSRRIYPATVTIYKDRISSIRENKERTNHFIVPGFVDAHIHIESSMVTPLAFSKVAMRHGTIAAVSDPHEIANVLGLEGVNYMIKNAAKSPMKILFGAPSCVPATTFESSGSRIDAKGISDLLENPAIGVLAEMMNFPGVIQDDPEVNEKLALAKKGNYPIDGHAPGLRGKDLEKYVAAGISTDHECFSYEEAIEKISLGMKILIREGSGAKNFNALIPLLGSHPDRIMFCTDDLHPNDLMSGHINLLVKRAIGEGYNVFDVLRAAGLNAAEHYGLNVGMLREGDPADFLIVDSLENWNVLETYINGSSVFKEARNNLEFQEPEKPNSFNVQKIQSGDLIVKSEGEDLRVIKAIDGELITKEIRTRGKRDGADVVADIENDILKIAVVNRYSQSAPAMGFISGFGIEKGAIASSIAHDSHNIICVGTSDDYMAEAINWIIEHKGGIVVNDGNHVSGLPLDIAGIMSSKSVEYASHKYKELTAIANEIGSEMKAPFMTLAFMALLVIPELKLSDKGLFNGQTFSFTPLFYSRDE
jgi:adenine deaminase